MACQDRVKDRGSDRVRTNRVFGGCPVQESDGQFGMFARSRFQRLCQVSFPTVWKSSQRLQTRWRPRRWPSRPAVGPVISASLILRAAETDRLPKAGRHSILRNLVFSANRIAIKTHAINQASRAERLAIVLQHKALVA